MLLLLDNMRESCAPLAAADDEEEVLGGTGGCSSQAVLSPTVIHDA
jgi:hypothetical protein